MRLTVAEMGSLLRSRKVSSVELVSAVLARLPDAYNSFITITGEQALRQAGERDAELARGEDRGPLHGIPIAHKDLFHTAGVRTTGASLLYQDFVPTEDAEVVTRLYEAGAVSVGKTNLHELAYGATSQSVHFGPVLNPRDPECIPGGSSGGSAAVVAAGILALTTGTDTGGSIRIPSSYCGVVGMMPTYGLVSRRGVMPLAFSLDHPGPIAQSVHGCALAMDAMTGTRMSQERVEVAGLRVCVPRNFFFDHVHEGVAKSVRHVAELLAENGAIVEEHTIPDLHEGNVAARVIQLCEAAALYARCNDPSLFGTDVWRLIEQGRMFAAHEYINAQRLRSVFRAAFDRLWENVDVMVAPTTPMAAPRQDQATVHFGLHEEDVRIASTRLTRGIAFTGEPALSLPCGWSEEGLPIGVQLIAAPGQDARLLAIGRRVEALL